jgi:hypothetical protein
MFLRDVKTGETKLTPKGPVIGETLVQVLQAPHLNRVETTLPFQEFDFEEIENAS